MLDLLIVNALYKISSRRTKKNFILNEMESTLSRLTTGFYTCSALCEIVQKGTISSSIFHEYQKWLRESIYFSRELCMIHVSINREDYYGKLAMFKEFLKQYEGEL